VRAVVKAYLGNGHGVSAAAEPSYERMLGALDPRQAGRALRAFTDPDVYSRLWSSIGKQQWSKLLELLAPKLIRLADRTLYEAIGEFTGQPHQLHADTKIARLAQPRKVVRRRSANGQGGSSSS
jgi:hypothetical protein